MTHILAIDQGTTSSRAILFDSAMKIAAVAQEEFTQHYPASGWVEHDAGDLWSTTAATCRAAIEKAGLRPGDIAAIGITNQRETTLVWDRKTGKPIHNAIVWQDRRTAPMCQRLKAEGHEATVTDRTGLLLDPYFSATKVAWLLDEVEGARARAEAGELAFGTVDSWLVWNLTGGAVHVTDATNAARTMLYDIRKGRWSQTMCDMLGVPMSMLPEVRDCASDFGKSRADLFGVEIPILGIAGDQQAATIGQACFEPGMLKSTYGTGCFALLHRRYARDIAQPSADDDCLPDGWRANICAGRIDLHCGGRCSMVARWADHPVGRGPSLPSAPIRARSVLVPAFTGLGALLEPGLPGPSLA